MKIPDTTVRHNVGTCPACRSYLWADVDIAVDVGEPTMTRDGSVIVNTSTTTVGMRVAHSCWHDDDGERHVLETSDLGDYGDIAESKRDAVMSAADIFRSMPDGPLIHASEVTALLDLRAESYRARESA